MRNKIERRPGESIPAFVRRELKEQYEAGEAMSDSELLRFRNRRHSGAKVVGYALALLVIGLAIGVIVGVSL